MRARVLLWFCLGLNVFLAGWIVLLWQEARGRSASREIVLEGQSPPPQVKTNVVIRRQAFSWDQIESQDFRTYIANLRNIGCPEHTIRDIIVADVNDLFAQRLAREVELPEQKWWLSEPDMDGFQQAMDQVRALETEKRALLTELLGPEWDQQSPLALANVTRFDGPVLGKLPVETRAAVEQIEANARRLRAELEERAREQGRQPAPTEIARLRQETRRELASVLSPEQLEEYLLRYSQTAEEMRDQLRGFGASQEEFRRIFRIRDSYDQQLASLNGADAATAARRTELERLRDEAIRREIPPERFEFYQLTHNPLFRQTQEHVEQLGAPPEKVLPIFRLQEVVQAEIARIQADTSMSDDQRRVAIAAVQQQQANSVERILANQPADQPRANVPEPLMPPMPEPRFLPPGILAVPR